MRQKVKPYNLRTKVIWPGAVDRDLPIRITEEDVATRVKKIYEVAVPADSFARAVDAMSQPDDININEILLGLRVRKYDCLDIVLPDMSRSSLVNLWGELVVKQIVCGTRGSKFR